MTRRVQKPWGHEEIWAETPHYLGKVLTIRAGKRLSLQHHERKVETIRVWTGQLDLVLENDAGELETHRMGPGDARDIPTGRRHRFVGVTDCQVLEVSTAHPNDVVRHEDDFGREGTWEP